MEVQKSPDVWLIKVSDGPISTLPRFLILYLNIERNWNSLLIFFPRYFRQVLSVYKCLPSCLFNYNENSCMKAYLCVELPKLYVQLQATSAIIFYSLHLDVIVDSRTQSFTCLLSPFLKKILLFWFWVLPWRKFPQEHVKQGKKAVTAHTDKNSS